MNWINDTNIQWFIYSVNYDACHFVQALITQCLAWALIAMSFSEYVTLLQLAMDCLAKHPNTHDILLRY